MSRRIGEIYRRFTPEVETYSIDESFLDLTGFARRARRKGCAVTRSFASRLTDRASLEQAVAAHATRLGEKLRREGLGTTHVTVFYHTSEHDRGDPQRSVSTCVSLPEATNDSLVLIKAAMFGVGQTWHVQGDRPWRYSKAGVVTVDLLPLEASPRALIGRLDRDVPGR